MLRDLINSCLYVTTNAGENYTVKQLNFTPSVIQFSQNEENYLFATGNIDDCVCLYFSALIYFVMVMVINYLLLLLMLISK